MSGTSIKTKIKIKNLYKMIVSSGGTDGSDVKFKKFLNKIG